MTVYNSLTEPNNQIDLSEQHAIADVKSTVTTSIPDIVYSTGKKKTSIARVWLKAGSGKYLVNGLSLEDYFRYSPYTSRVLQSLILTSMESKIDITCTVKGGGLSSQAYSLRHGIAKCLNIFDPKTRSLLKPQLLLRRDSRVVERKKYGQHKARKKKQFSKR